MRAPRLSSLLAIAASLILSSACSADEQTPEHDLSSSLTRLNRLLQDANLNPDNEIITHASSIVQRVRSLVSDADQGAEMVRTAKKERAAQRNRARTEEKRKQRRRATEQEQSRALLRGGGIGNGEAMKEAAQQGLELEVKVAALHLRWLLDQMLDESPS